jgi:hypothetical protein
MLGDHNTRVSLVAVAVDAVRHALPLVPLYVYDGDFASYVLMTAFDLSLGLMLIVGTTRERGDVNSVDPRSRWLVAQIVSALVVGVFLVIVSAIISLPIGAPAIIFGMRAGVDWAAVVSRRGFWIPIGVMSLVAAARYQVTFNARTTPGRRGQPTRGGPVVGNLEADRRRSLAANAAQVTLIGTFAALGYVLFTFGQAGFYALPAMYGALLVFYDARPDIAHRIFPKLWREQ